LINGLSAKHSSCHVFGEAKASDVVHSMVIKHPLSGRPALYVNPQFTTKILGLSEIESAGLLKTLLTIACDQTYNAASGMAGVTLPCGTTARYGTRPTLLDASHYGRGLRVA